GRFGLHRIGSKVLRGGFSFLRKSLSSRQKNLLAEAFPSLRKRAELAYTSFQNIDWDRTKAYCSEVLASPPSIWINLKGVKPRGIVEPAEYDALTDFIIEKLRELKDPRTGEPIIARVYRRQENFHSPFAGEGADLVLDSPVPEDMDGKVLPSAFRPEFLTAHPVRAGNASGVSETRRQSGYTEQESAKVEERLRALGYLE